MLQAPEMGPVDSAALDAVAERRMLKLAALLRRVANH